MSNLADSTPAVSHFFTCTIDGLDLGQWSTCSGLSINFDVQNRHDTAREFMAHRIPGKVSFGNIKLGRPVCGYTYQCMTWFMNFAVNPQRLTAAISALDQMGAPLQGLTWNLIGVIPVSWTGPSFDINSAKVPEEQLELAFNGFQP